MDRRARQPRGRVLRKQRRRAAGRRARGETVLRGGHGRPRRLRKRRAVQLGPGPRLRAWVRRREPTRAHTRVPRTRQRGRGGRRPQPGAERCRRSPRVGDQRRRRAGEHDLHRAGHLLLHLDAVRGGARSGRRRHRRVGGRLPARARSRAERRRSACLGRGRLRAGRRRHRGRQRHTHASLRGRDLQRTPERRECDLGRQPPQPRAGELPLGRRRVEPQRRRTAAWRSARDGEDQRVPDDQHRKRARRLQGEGRRGNLEPGDRQRRRPDHDVRAQVQVGAVPGETGHRSDPARAALADASDLGHADAR